MNLLKDGSYHILGLDAAATQKEVSRRSKEILTRLKIQDVPEYDLDLNFIEDFRTEDAVKKAVTNLSTPKKHVKEYFFWLQISDDVDEEALSLLKMGKYDDAANVWRSHAGGENTKSFLYKKNLAVFITALLYRGKDAALLEESVKLWGDLINSEKFWSAFSRVYKIHDELGAEQQVIDDFKKSASGYISDIYTGLTSLHKDNDFITIFSKNFGLRGEKIESDVLNPIYEVINDSVEKLEALRVSDDGVLDNNEREQLRKLIDTIQSQLNKLIDLGLYEESKIKLVRDRAAATLRRLSIEINNNLNETSIALGLSKIADGMSGTQSFKSKVQQDIKTLEENQSTKLKTERQKSVVDPILEDYKNGKAEQALQTINSYIYNPNTDQELKNTLIEIKKVIEERMVTYGKPIGGTPTMYTLNGVGTRIYGDTLYFVILFIPIIPIARYSLIDHGDGSYTFQGKLELHPWQKNWRIVAIIALPILFILLMGS